MNLNPPKLLKIELNETCNAKCIFCESERMGGAKMNFEDYCQAVLEFLEAQEVQPQFFGEPLLYPQLAEAIRFAKSQRKRVSLYTNGALLRGRIAQDIAEAAPDRIIISIEADNAELYSKLRPGLDFDAVVENMEAFRAIRKPATRLDVRMTVCAENRDRITEISRFWAARVDAVYSAPEMPQSRYIPIMTRKGQCQRPFEQLVIKADGRVVLCCVDLHGDYPFGNIRDGLRSVWDNKENQKIRAQVNSPNPLSLCKTCPFFSRPSYEYH